RAAATVCISSRLPSASSCRALRARPLCASMQGVLPRASRPCWWPHPTSGSTFFRSGTSRPALSSTMTNQAIELPRVRVDGSRLGIEHIVALAERTAVVGLSADAAFRARIQRGADFLDRLLREDGVVYGVTTGYGDSCTVAIPS